jgi:hypothetical protein
LRALGRLLLVAGALGVGALLFRAAPHQVELVYDLSRTPGATGVEVELRRDGALVRRAELRVAGSPQLHHPVRLPDGDYLLSFRISAPGGTVSGERAVAVREGGTIVLPLGP